MYFILDACYILSAGAAAVVVEAVAAAPQPPAVEARAGRGQVVSSGAGGGQEQARGRARALGLQAEVWAGTGPCLALVVRGMCAWGSPGRPAGWRAGPAAVGVRAGD